MPVGRLSYMYELVTYDLFITDFMCLSVGIEDMGILNLMHIEMNCISVDTLGETRERDINDSWFSLALKGSLKKLFPFSVELIRN